MSQLAIKNSFWFLSINLVRLIVSLVSTILISRYLGAEKFGEFSYILSIFLLMYSFDAICNQNEIKKYFLLDGCDNETVLGTSLNIHFYINGFIFILLAIWGGLFIESSELLISLIILAVIGFAKPFNILSVFFDSRLESFKAGSCLLAGIIVASIVRITFALESKSIILQSVGFTFQISVTMLALVYCFKGSILKWKLDKALRGDILRRSFPFFLGALFTAVLLRADTIMLAQIVGSKEVGLYNVMLKLCDPLVIVCTSICTSAFPLLVKLKKSGVEKYPDLLKNINTVLFYSSLFMGIIGYLFIDEAVSILFGAEYLLSADYFKYYYFVVVMLFSSNFQAIWEVLEGEYHFYLLRTFIAATTNVALNFVFIPKWGAIGAAVATLISFFILSYGVNLLKRKTRGYLLIQLKSLHPMSLFMVYKKYREIRGEKS